MMKIIQASIPTTAPGLRDRAALELLYSTGIRKRELVNLSLGDFQVKSYELLIVNGKGGKDRVILVGEWACYFTEAYVKNVLAWRVFDPTEKALFVQHRNGRRPSPRAVRDIVERATVKSGVGRRVSQHTFLHAMATHMLRNHADLRHIQAILGHMQPAEHASLHPREHRGPKGGSEALPSPREAGEIVIGYIPR